MSNNRLRRFGSLIGAVDAGTSKVRFLVFSSETAEMLTYHQLEIKTISPQEGWIEQDPAEIFSSVRCCMESAIDNLRQLDIDPADIRTIGISNQRETVIVWNKITGEPLYNAIVWSDVRNKNTVKEFINKSKRRNPEFLKPLCGLPISTYFSALKLRWLIDNVPSVKASIEDGTCMFGTVDSWLIWNLTGGNERGLHITDVTNASRTMLMNIHTLKWDPSLLMMFDIPEFILPTIRSSSEIYGYVWDVLDRAVPISGCLGDQQAALVGQMCFEMGQVKNSFGIGSFLLYNTGKAKIWSENGLLTTVAYKFGKDGAPVYALEGSVAVAGTALAWLRDKLNLLEDYSEIEKLAEKSTGDNSDVYFVPAFRGLYAPYWQTNARSLVCGLSENTRREDVVKATLEAICFQTRDVLESLALDCGDRQVKQLLVDSGMSSNDYIMQLLANIIGIPVVRPIMTETTALGAAIAAGSADGIKIWDFKKVQPIPTDIFYPLIPDSERNVKYYKWKMAVRKSIDWEISAGEAINLNPNVIRQRLLSMVPCSIFLMSSFGLLLLAEHFRF